MNDHRHSKDFCYYHPKQLLLGICPFCLNDKLLLVAAEQGRRNHRREVAPQPTHSRKPSNAGLPKIFAFGSLLSRRKTYERRECGVSGGGGGSDTQSTSPSLEDSFISMKFEENGVALWDKSKVSKGPEDQPTKPPPHDAKALFREGSWKSNSSKSVVEHSKSTPRGSLRWRKRIGHLLQLVRWKGGAKKAHVVESFGGVKVRNKGWIRTLTRRRNSKT